MQNQFVLSISQALRRAYLLYTLPLFIAKYVYQINNLLQAQVILLHQHYAYLQILYVYLMKQLKRICLFDVDVTLTKSRQKIQKQMLDCLQQLRQVMDIGYVGGSDLHKISYQLTEEGIEKGRYLFSENGLLAFQGTQIIGKQEIGGYLGEDRLKKFINFCLKYLSELDIPIKRGTFIEYRTGLINVSPIGRNCTPQQRDQFEIYDKQNQIRKKFIEELKKNFADYNLCYSIGGQISFDVFPVGWDKTYCLRYLKEYDEIYFFGDKTFPGGNDYELYELLRKQGRAFSVNNYHETIKLITQTFLTKKYDGKVVEIDELQSK